MFRGVLRGELLGAFGAIFEASKSGPNAERLSPVRITIQPIKNSVLASKRKESLIIKASSGAKRVNWPRAYRLRSLDRRESHKRAYCSGAGGCAWFMRCCIRASCLASICFTCDCWSGVSNWYSSL